MNKIGGWAILVVVLAVVLGPVLIKKFTPDEARPLYGVQLSSLQYVEAAFRNRSQNLDLAGMLFLPEGEGPFPAVVIIHGAGTSQRDNPWYLALTHYLQENGVVVLLPDKRGSEKSGGDWRTSSLEDLAGDTLAAVDFLKEQDLASISQIGIVGASQGGQLSPLVAVKSSDIAFLIDLVGTSLPLYDVLHYEEVNNLREMGFLPGISDLIAYPSTWVLRKFAQKDFWDAVGNFDALPYWEALSIPALVLYGRQDTNVPAEASQARLESLDKENIRVIIYEGSGHPLQDPVGSGDRIFREAALQEIANFIHSIP
jgi:dipeptidyl aminopeptidase/acylaminoacyl peptidase